MAHLQFVLLGALVLSRLSAADVEFVTPELPWAVVDKPYAPPPLEVRMSGACTSGGLGYSVVSGALPPGLALSRLGYFSGVPLSTGSFEFAVRVATGCSWTTKHFVLFTTGAPVLASTPLKLDFRASAGLTTVAIEQIVRISSTWPKLPFRVISSADWLTAVPEHGFTPRQTSALDGDGVHIRVDPFKLKPGRYEGFIGVTAWEALEELRIPVELTVTEQAP